jgi:hypothetical protein
MHHRGEAHDRAFLLRASEEDRHENRLAERVVR